MAISLVGTAQGGAINGLGPTINLPVGTTEGDFVLVSGGHRAAENPAGVSTSGYSNPVDVTVDYRFTVSYKFMGATPDTEVVCIGASSSALASTYVVQVFRGVDPTTPLDATPTSSNGQDEGQDPDIPDTPAIVSVTDGAAIITAVGARASDTSITPPDGYGDLVNINAVDDIPSTTAAAWLIGTTAGSYDPDAWADLIASNAWGGATIALRPQSEEGSTGTAAGRSTATGGGARITSQPGTASGQSTAAAVAFAPGDGDGLAEGQSTAAASSILFADSAGVAAGAAVAEGGSPVVEGAGSIAGASTANGVLAVRRTKVRVIQTTIGSQRSVTGLSHTGLN